MNEQTKTPPAKVMEQAGLASATLFGVSSITPTPDNGSSRSRNGDNATIPVKRDPGHSWLTFAGDVYHHLHQMSKDTQRGR